MAFTDFAALAILLLLELLELKLSYISGCVIDKSQKFIPHLYSPTDFN